MNDHISAHFTKQEMQCPTTGRIQLAEGYIELLEKLRKEYNRPMMVTSACRTHAHNVMINGHPRSLHLIDNLVHKTDTCATDIVKPAGGDLHDLVRIATNQQWSISIRKLYVHLDMRYVYLGLPPRVF